MTTEFNFNTETGKNRALVCYCTTPNISGMRDTITSVFESQNIDIEPFIDGGGETVWTISNVVVFSWEEAISTLDIRLEFADKIKRLKVGGEFETLSIGVFLYDQPAPPPEPEIDPDDDTVLDDEPEPEPTQPSLTELVCSALQNEFGGVYGASVFVIHETETAFTLEVE